jgi:heavy metal sensor kinase
MNTRSLRFQLGLWYAGLLTCVFLLLGAATVLVLKHYLESSVRDSQRRRSKQIAQALTPAVLNQGPGRLRDEIEARFSPGLNNWFVRVRKADGKILYESNVPQDRTFSPRAVPGLPWVKRDEATSKVPLADGPELLIVSRAFREPDGTLLNIETGASLEAVQAVLRHVLVVMTVTLLLAIAVAVTGGYYLVRRALATVDHISRSAEQISFQNLSERLPVSHSGDEIEHLSLALNRMIQRLDEAFQHSKRFVADASHELRTPLTILRGELESLAQQEVLSPPVPERLGSLLEETDRLAKVVEGLLTLSRLDAGEAKGEWIRLDLAELTVSTADQMSLLAEDKNISIRCDTPSPVVIQGDRTRLKQVVVNLLDNAIKYTAEGGKITLQVHAQGENAILDVQDNGIGIPADVLPHVFERFFRADKARSRDLGGAGLGLAIVQSICLAHGGRVQVQSREGQGSLLRVELPLAPTHLLDADSESHHQLLREIVWNGRTAPNHGAGTSRAPGQPCANSNRNHAYGNEAS